MISSDLSSLDVRTYQPPVGLLAIAALCVILTVWSFFLVYRNFPSPDQLR